MPSASLLRFFAPAAILLPLALSAACSDSADDASGGGGATGGTEGVGAGLEAGICIDRAGPLRIVEPAGLQLKFRVLDINGDPLRPLVAEDVGIINDEKGVPFGLGSEGDSVSNVGSTDNIQIYSIVALDLSDSIFAAGAQDDVINAAREFVSAVVAEPEEKFKHKVLFLPFGRPIDTVFMGDFSQDVNELNDRLDEAVDAGPRGTTALYNAYLAGLNELELRGDDSREVVERFLVLLTDGTHEAGGETTLRELSLAAKHLSRATVYTVGIQGAYDACRLEELAGRGATPCSSATRGCREGNLCTATPQPPSCTQFFPDVEAGGLTDAFRDVAARVEGIARSNYSVGICTPVAQSNSSVTLQVAVDGMGDQTSLGYCAQGAAPCETGDQQCPCAPLLTGELSACDAESVRTVELPPIQACPGMDPATYQCSYLQIADQTEAGCPIKPDDFKSLCLNPGEGSGGGGTGGGGAGGAGAGGGGTGGAGAGSGGAPPGTGGAPPGTGGAPGAGGAGGTGSG